MYHVHCVNVFANAENTLRAGWILPRDQYLRQRIGYSQTWITETGSIAS